MTDATPPYLDAFKAKVGIVKRFGYFTMPAGTGDQVLAFKGNSALTTELFPGEVQAVLAMWEDFKSHHEIWVRGDDLFIKLHDARVAETNAPAFVLEHIWLEDIWPYHRGVFVFADLAEFRRLTDIEAEVAAERPAPARGA